MCIRDSDKSIEDIRMHRVVFCKSMTFRWFADFEPMHNSILIKIQKNRKTPIESLEVFPDNDITELKQILKDAFDSIH